MMRSEDVKQIVVTIVGVIGLALLIATAVNLTA